MATLLLDKGADVNAQGGYYGNALQAASAGGHKEMATLLLDKGADVNAQGGEYGNALQAASANGHKEMATLLLEMGAVTTTLPSFTEFGDGRVTDPQPGAFTDSGYGSKTSKMVEEAPTSEADMDNEGSIYSSLSVPESVSAGYISEIAQDLLKRLDFDSLDSQGLERIYNVLPDHLKALALKVGYGTEDKELRDTMVFICRFRK
jgi:ankyrin repeat protein